MKKYGILLAGCFVLFFCLGAVSHADNIASGLGISDAAFAKIVFGIYALNSILSSLRAIAAKYDGIQPGEQKPSEAQNFLNKLCMALGKVLDFIQGNVQH